MRYYMVKRRHQRISVAILIDIYLTESSIPKGRGCIVNISIGGMAIESSTDLGLNTEIFLRVELDPEVFSFHGQIVRKDSKGPVFHYGVRYKKMSWFEKFKLRRYINSWIKTQIKKEASPQNS